MEYVVFAVIAFFLALVVFSIVLNVRDMRWFVDFTDGEARERLLALKLDGARIARFRRRRNRFGRFGGADSLSDYVQIPLDAPLPQDVLSAQFVSRASDECDESTPSASKGARVAAKAVVSVARGTAFLSDSSDLLVVFGTKGGKERRIYSCDFTRERLLLAEDVLSVLQKG